VTRRVGIRGSALAVHCFEPKVHRGDAVLIHGFAGSKEDFSFIGPLLAGCGYRVITFDNRGQHESAHSERAEDYSITSLAHDALALSGHFALQQPHLLGHSFGGLVAQQAVVFAPQAWASVTLLGSGPGAVPDHAEYAATAAALQQKSMVEVWDESRAELLRDDPRYAMKRRRWSLSDPRSVITHAHHLMVEPSIVDAVGATRVPVHVIHGEHDEVWPRTLQAGMAQRLGARLTVIEDAGHSPAAERPEATARLVAEFWDSLR